MKSALAFWEKYPSPDLLLAVSTSPNTKGASPGGTMYQNTSPAAELASLLRVNSNNTLSLLKAEKIVEQVIADGMEMRPYQEQRYFLIQSIVRDIRFKQEEVRRVEEQIQIMMNQVDYKLETMPVIGLVTAASFVAEIGDIKRFANADKLARLAGIASTAFGSGEKGGRGDNHKKCRQGSRILHELFYQLAVQQVHKHKSGTLRNPNLYSYYKDKIGHGKTNGQAMVCVMRRLVNTIYGMMKTNTAYVQPMQQGKRAS